MRPQERISRLVSKLGEFEVDGVLLFDMKNIRYFTGFTGSDGCLIIAQDRNILMVDGRYITQARREVGSLELFEYRDKLGALEEILSQWNHTVLGFESAVMTVDVFQRLKEKLKGIELKALSDRISMMRAVKDEEEIECMRMAASIAHRALTAVKDVIKPGIREKDIALELEFRIGKEGGESVSFPTIVASGANSALPHCAPGDRKLEYGDVVMIDFGAVYCGYHSDETWTFVVGECDDTMRKVYGLLKEAYERALSAVRSGISCREIDRIARKCIEDGGMGEYFTHGTGHGVGLDVHEAPRLNTQSESVLETGMVVTIEPGVYIPNLWGMRVEDMVLVKNEGCEVLTKVLKEFEVH